MLCTCPKNLGKPSGTLFFFFLNPATSTHIEAMQATDRRKLPQSDEVTLAEVNSELGMRLLCYSLTERVLVS